MSELREVPLNRGGMPARRARSGEGHWAHVRSTPDLPHVPLIEEGDGAPPRARSGVTHLA